MTRDSRHGGLGVQRDGLNGQHAPRDQHDPRDQHALPDSCKDEASRQARLIHLVGEIRRLVRENPKRWETVSTLPFFKELALWVGDATLGDATDLFARGCDLLEDKLAYLESVIGLADKTAQLLAWVQRVGWPDAHARYVQPNWFAPLSLVTISNRYLRGATRLFRRTRKKREPLEAPAFVKEELAFNLAPPAQFFENRKTEFHDALRSQLPNSLAALLARSEDEDAYYENFIFILHLLQEGEVFLKKKRPAPSRAPAEDGVPETVSRPVAPDARPEHEYFLFENKEDYA